MALADRSCPVCTPSTPLASPEEIAAWSGELHEDWSIVDGHLARRWRFPDFASALAFADRVGAVAEAEQHHPDLLVGWGKVRAELWTHVIGGLSEADFVLAAKLDRL